MASFASWPRARQLTLIAAAAAVLLVALVAALLVARGGSSAEAAGLVILDGERVEAPYTVTSSGGAVSINGRTALTYAPALPSGDPVAPAPGNDAFDLVDQAARAYLEAGGGRPGEAAALALFADHPAHPDAQVLDNPRRIEVTDADGLTLSFRIEVPDALAHAAPDGQADGLAAETAARWGALLGDGGGLVVSSTGVSLEIQPDGVQGFRDRLDAALAASGAARDRALAELLQAPALIEEQGGTPPDPEEQARRIATADRLVSDTSRHGPRAAVRQAAAGSAKTPGKKEAYIYAFTVLNMSDSRPFSRAVQLEGYAAWQFVDSTRFGNFLSTSGTGALYNVTHSSPTSLTVASFPNIDDARAEVRRMTAQRIPRDAWDGWRDADGRWWIDITAAGIQRYWRSNDTIVHSASCQGAGLAAAFRAREFFGYQPVTSCAIALPDSQKLWGRWSGEIGDGQYRSASRAFAQGGFSDGFRYTDGSPDSDTVLSPSVVAAQADTIVVGGEGAAVVGFDAVMDTSVDPNRVIEVSGCAHLVERGQWQFGAVLSVPLRGDSVGDYEVRVRAADAQSPAHINLDGNTNPDQKPGVVVNRDDHLIHGRCVAAGTETPATEPTSTEGSATPGNAAPTVQVAVLVLGGEHFPVEQFIRAQADRCSSEHWHAHQPVRSLEGSVIVADPNPGECGFGPVPQVPATTVDWPEDEFNAWKQATGR